MAPGVGEATVTVAAAPIAAIDLPERPWSSARPGLARCDLPFGRITVEHGDRITVDTADWPRLRPWVTGTGFALAATQAGRVVIHASTVVIDGAAIAVTGPSGAGKSTLVGALLALGGRILAEDVTALHDGLAWPGPRHVRLADASAAALGLVDLPVEPDPDEPHPKRVWAPPTADAPAPLAAVWSVTRADPGDAPRLVPRSHGWGVLVTNGYTLRLMHEDERIHHLRACADIARHLQVFDAAVPHDLASLLENARKLLAALPRA